MLGSLEASVVVEGAGTAVSGVAVGGLAAEGELTSSAQEVPEAGWKEDAATFIPVVLVVLESGFVMRSAREPPAGVFGKAMLAMQVAEDTIKPLCRLFVL